MRSLRFSGIVGLGLGLALASACSAGKGGGGSGIRGDGGNGSGASSSGGAGSGVNSGAGTAANINTGANGGTDPDAGGCQHEEYTFVPKVPTVFVLVDRSDSMFTPDNMTQVTSWDPLKAGVIDVVTQLQAQIRFGFGAFTGQQAQGATGAMCPIFNSIAPALNNAAAITGVYQPLGRVMGAKGETPVMKVLPLVQDLLNQDDNGGGDKYILFVTDGEPDFCDDGDPACPVDAVVSHVQQLAAQGINTIVFGIKTSQSPISDQTLQAVANAGASLPVASPFIQNMVAEPPENVCNGCKSVAGWAAEWPTGTPPADCHNAAKQTLGTYAAAAGAMATVYHPDPSDQAALTAQIASVVSGIKTCTFNLDKVTVNLDRLSEASVTVEGQPVPLDMTNGWRMNTVSQLELVGDACSNWKQPQNTKIDFNFPCDILVPVK